MTLLPHPHDEYEKCPGGCDDVLTVESDVCKAQKDITELNKRIQDGHDQMQRFEARLDEGNSRMSRIEKSISDTSIKLDINTRETTEILDILRSGKAFFRVADNLTSAVKWIAGIGTAVLLFWYAIKDWPRH